MIFVRSSDLFRNVFAHSDEGLGTHHGSSVRWRAVIDCTATARIQRLIRWLEPFQRGFGHRAQRLALGTVRAWPLQRQLFEVDAGDVGPRHRTRSPTKAFSIFITHAAWDADRVWRRLLEVLPERGGVLIHRRQRAFPNRAPIPSAWRVRTCGALGKIANCQVAVTAALWTGARAWVTGALLYLPKEWLSDLRSTDGSAHPRRRILPRESGVRR